MPLANAHYIHLVIITFKTGLGVGDIPVRRYYRGKLSHDNYNQTSFSSWRLLRNAHYCAVRMHSGPHAQGTTMASSTRSEVLVCCGISVVKKWNTTSVVWDYFGLWTNPDGSIVRGELPRV